MHEGQSTAILDECARSHRHAVRWAALTALLLSVLIAATVFAAATGRYRGLIVVLAPVLLAINTLRLAQCAVGLLRIRHTERLIRQAPAR